MSQTHQIIAALFPLLALVVAGLTVVAVRRPWRRHKPAQEAPVSDMTMYTSTVGVAINVITAAKDLERRAHDLAQDLERNLVR